MPTNAELWERRSKAVGRGVNTAHPVFAARAENAELWDVEGKRYIDFVGGIGSQNTGHRHPKVMKAIAAQAANVLHTAYQVNAYESYITLAEKLNALAPIEGPAKTLLFTTGADALEALDWLVKTEIEPARVAAVIIEPVQGEGGFNIAPPEFLRTLRGLCDEHGILLIADEIQTGFARTGKMFALEHSGIKADVVTLAKGLAGGLPLSAITGRADVMEAASPGGLGGTYAGNPVACAAAHAVLDIIEDEKLCERANAIGKIIMDRCVDIQERSNLNCIGDVRGLGAMCAIELVTDTASHEPAPALTAQLLKTAADKGLILLSCGTYGNVIRFLVPLTASDALVSEGMDVFAASLTEAVGKVA